jgi:hypothetical protein
MPWAAALLSARRSVVPRWILGLTFAGAACFATHDAWAQPVDDATRSSARQLADEAIDLFDKGDYAGALLKYEHADALVHLPTLQVREARCLDKLGRLVEAAERYVAVTRMELPSDALQVHRDALADAEKELAAVRERIPSLIITVVGARDAKVTIDDAVIPSTLWGEKRAVDPGRHHVALESGTKHLSRDVDVHEHEVVPVDLEVASASEAPRVESAGVGPTGVAGIVVGVIGVLGMGAGVVTGALAKSSYDDAFTEQHCAKQGGAIACDDGSRLRAARSTANIGTGLFAAGGALTATGLVLLIVDLAKPKNARVVPDVQLGDHAAMFGVRGSL